MLEAQTNCTFLSLISLVNYGNWCGPGSIPVAVVHQYIQIYRLDVGVRDAGSSDELHLPLPGLPGQLRQLVWTRVQREGSGGRCRYMLSGPIHPTFLNELFHRDMTCATTELTSLDYAMGCTQPWSPTHLNRMQMEPLPALIALERRS